MQTDRLGSIKELFVTVVGIAIEDCTKIISHTLAPLILVSSFTPDQLKAAANTPSQHSNLWKVGDTYEVASPIIDVGSQQNSTRCCDKALEVDHQAHVWFQCLRGFHWKTQERLWQDDVV